MTCCISFLFNHVIAYDYTVVAPDLTIKKFMESMAEEQGPLFDYLEYAEHRLGSLDLGGAVEADGKSAIWQIESSEIKDHAVFVGETCAKIEAVFGWSLIPTSHG